MSLTYQHVRNLYLNPFKKHFVVDIVSGVNWEGKINEHKKLFKLTKELTDKQVKFAMSNAKVELITENFKDYKMEETKARRAINSKNPGASTTEVIIYN